MRPSWALCVAALALAATAGGRWLGRAVPNRIDYCSLCEPPGTHTMCVFPSPGPGANCTGYRPAPLSPREKRAILHTHNVVRQRVANGFSWAKGSGHGAQPSAADMHELRWDRELEALAKRWADQCLPFYTNTPHDDCRDALRFPVGQNIVTTAYSKPSASDVRARSLDWYGELVHFDPSWVRRFQPNPDPDPRKQIGHYTQMVWGWTYAIGCSRVVFEETIEGQAPWTVERLVCNYAPSGNFIDYPVYTEGPPCSACPKGTVCSLRYPGLCAVLDVDDPEGEATSSEEEEERRGRGGAIPLTPFAWWSPAPRSGRPRPRPYIDVDVEVEGGGGAEEEELDETQVLGDIIALEEGLERPDNYTWGPTAEGVWTNRSPGEPPDSADAAAPAAPSVGHEDNNAPAVSDAEDDLHDVPAVPDAPDNLQDAPAVPDATDNLDVSATENPVTHNATASRRLPSSDGYAPQGGSYTPQDGSYTPQDGSYTPQDGSYTPQDGSYISQGGSYTSQGGSYTPQGGSYTPQVGSYTAQEGSNTDQDASTQWSQGSPDPTAPVPTPAALDRGGGNDASEAPFVFDPFEVLSLSSEGSNDEESRAHAPYYYSYAFAYADSSL